MIFDANDRLEVYSAVVPYMEEIAEELRSKDYANDVPAGVYHTAKSNITIQVQEYDTNPDPKFEVHAKFIDIHMMLIGEEYYDCARCLKEVPEGFVEANDIGFFESAIETRVKLTPGVFALSYPFEPHRPRVSVSGKPEKTKKIVVKIPYPAN